MQSGGGSAISHSEKQGYNELVMWQDFNFIAV
jgi:hypothetical protein